MLSSTSVKYQIHFRLAALHSQSNHGNAAWRQIGAGRTCLETTDFCFPLVIPPNFGEMADAVSSSSSRGPQLPQPEAWREDGWGLPLVHPHPLDIPSQCSPPCVSSILLPLRMLELSYFLQFVVEHFSYYPMQPLLMLCRRALVFYPPF